MPRNCEGWLRKRNYAEGWTWLYCYQTTRSADGRRVEHTKRVGLVCDLPSPKAAWIEVAKLGLNLNVDNPVGGKPTFAQLAEHFMRHELDSDGTIARKAAETAARDKHNLHQYVIPRWRQYVAMEIKPLEVEYKHAQRHGLIPQGSYPVQIARCKTTSTYEAKIVSPEQTIVILKDLDQPGTKLQWTLVLLLAATALRPEEAFGLKWSDVDWRKNQINIRRGWSKGKITAGKSIGSMTQVPMHSILAAYLKQWREQSPYHRDTDWIFASAALKGKAPLTASTCAKRYLRPAAVKAGVLSDNDTSRFGWHNLRHSLATFLAVNTDLKTAQTILRHKRIATTAEIYAHAVQSNQLAAQSQYLAALKVAGDAVG